jgi:hypothetical protein
LGFALDPNSGTKKKESVKGKSLPQVLAVSPDGALVACGGLNPEGRLKPAVVVVFDAATLEQISVFHAHTGAVTGLSFTRDEGASLRFGH